MKYGIRGDEFCGHGFAGGVDALGCESLDDTFIGFYGHREAPLKGGQAPHLWVRESYANCNGSGGQDWIQHSAHRRGPRHVEWRSPLFAWLVVSMGIAFVPSDISNSA